MISASYFWKMLLNTIMEILGIKIDFVNYVIELKLDMEPEWNLFNNCIKDSCGNWAKWSSFNNRTPAKQMPVAVLFCASDHMT